jgi:hypothetical protein
MIRAASIAIATFTIACMLGTFSLSWMVLGAIGVPSIGAFCLSLFYSLIPIVVWVMEQHNLPEESNANRITPVLDDYTTSHIDASCKPSKH